MSIWETKKLGEVIKLEYGKPLPKESREEGGKYPAYGANGVKCWSNQYYLDRPSIIVGRKGSAGEVNLTEEKFWPLDVTYFVTYDHTQYDLTFLYHCLKYLQLTRLAKGVKPGVNRNDVYQIEFAFPPLSEQKRIVAILDEAFEGIDRAIANTEKNLANSGELFESYLNAIFNQKGDGWVEKKLGNLLETLTDYHANGSYEILKQNVRLLDNDGYAYMVRSTDFEKNFTNNLKYIDKHAYEFLSKSKVFGGEIIISKIGNAGKVYLMPSIDRPCSLAMNLFLLRTNVDQIRSDYLYFFLESRFGKMQISERLNGTTTKTIRKDGIRSLNISVAPLPEQKNIVDKLNSIISETQHLETIYRQKIAALTELKQSILQKAFTGELTADTASQTTKAAQRVNAA